MPLHGAHVLLVEDEALINMNTTEMLERIGCDVRSFFQLDEARAEAAVRRPDIALLNIRIGRYTSYELAEWLDLRRVPIVFVTGYERESIDEKWRDRPVCRKPCEESDIRREMTRALTVSGDASEPA